MAGCFIIFRYCLEAVPYFFPSRKHAALDNPIWEIVL